MRRGRFFYRCRGFFGGGRRFGGGVGRRFGGRFGSRRGFDRCGFRRGRRLRLLHVDGRRRCRFGSRCRRCGGQGGEFLQVFNHAFQFGNTLVGFLQRGFLAGEFFLQRADAGILAGVIGLHTARDDNTVARGGLIRRGNRRGDGAGAAAGTFARVGNRGLVGNAGQTVAVGVEVCGLGAHLTARFATVDRFDGVGIGHTQDGTGAQTVDVAVNEGVRVGAQQGDEHLVQIATAAQLTTGNGREGVATHDAVFVATARDHRRGGALFALCRGGRLRRGLGDGRRRLRNRRGTVGRNARFADGFLRHTRAVVFVRHGGRGRRDERRRGFGRRGNAFDRVEQEGVFARGAAFLPVEGDDHVNNRFIDRLLAGELDEGALATLFDRGGNFRHQQGIGDVGALEGVHVGNAGAELARFAGGGADFNFSVQRLPQTTFNMDVAQTGGLNSERQGCNGCRENGSSEFGVHG